VTDSALRADEGGRMGRHSGAYEPAPEEWRPEDYGEDDGHSPVTRRAVLGILGVAGAAAACVGGVSVVANKPTGAPADGSMPAGTPARPVGLAAGAAGVTAPTSDMKTAYQRELSTSYSPQKAPKAPATSAFFQGPTVLTLDQDLHVGRRLSFGLTPALVTQIRRVGRTNWINSQLAMQPEDPELAALLRRYPLLTTPPAQIKAMFDANEGKPDDQKLDYHAVSDQLVEARLARSAWSRNQLHEKVCDVLRSVLHTPAYNDKIRMTVADFDRNVIQKYAYGRFTDMLEAFRRHPAPRVYLDNQLSDGNSKDDQGFKINQNWAREWLELFTVRPTDYVTGKQNYDPRKDVVQMAFLMSGLTVDEKTQSSRYDPDMHYRSPVKVMTFSAANRDPAAGERLTQQVVQYLANHPSTATNLAADFARAFLVDAPPKDLVKRMAAAYTQNRTAIVPMLRVLFSSREFGLSVGQKYRTAEEYAAAGLRALGAGPAPNAQDALNRKTGTLDGLRDLSYQIGKLGGSSLQKDSPDGQAFHKAAWLSGFGTIERWNMSMSFAGMYWKGIQRPELTTLYSTRPRTYGEAISALGRRLAFQPLSAANVTALLGFLGKTAASPVGDDLSLGGRLTQVVALILNAPEGLTYR
jgi:uncharacterized protein (DUF1800 family)